MWAPTLPVSFGSYPSTKRPVVVATARPPRFSSDEELGGLGHAVLNAIQSPSSSSSQTLISAADTSERGEESIRKRGGEKKKEERELSGSEVLLALQKARARRSQRLKTGKKKNGGSTVEGCSRGGGESEVVDCRNVRQLNIKSDWGVRLEELEKRLQEFIIS